MVELKEGMKNYMKGNNKNLEDTIRNNKVKNIIRTRKKIKGIIKN